MPKVSVGLQPGRPLASAGLLMFRRRDGKLEVLLAHPGGPYWSAKDEGVWSIPKGELKDGENHFAAAAREFEEETGIHLSGEEFIPLAPITQANGKIVHAWAFEGDCDTSEIRSNTLEIEWPPRSGKSLEIPEIDRAEFFSIEDAKRKINPAQIPIIEELEKKLELEGAY